jgi:uncharacterized protein (TIGR03067 family)
MFRRVASLLLLCALIAADDAKDEKKTDRDRLRGTWTCVSMERNGKPIPPESYKDGKLIMEGDTFTYKKGDEVVTQGTRKLDPTQSPKAVDDTHTLGPFKGKTYLGIYKLEGDTFTTCNGSAGRLRPIDFATRRGTNLLLVVYKREKPREH